MADKFKPLTEFEENPVTGADREPSPAFDEAMYWKDPTAGDVKYSLAPLTLTFPNTEIGFDSAVVPVILANTGLVDFTISSMDIYGDYFIETPFTGVVAAGTSIEINVGFRPNSSTELTGTLVIQTSLPADQTKQMIVTMTGWGYGTSITTLPLDIFKHEVLTQLNVDTYSFDEDGNALLLLPEQNIVMGMSPYGILTEGVDYTILPGGGFQFTGFMPEANELFHIIAFPSMYQQNTRELLDVYTAQAKELVGGALYMRKQKINIVSGTTLYTTDADGQDLEAMPARTIILSSPNMPHWIEVEDYTVETDGSIQFLADPGVTGVVQLITLPIVFNNEAQALIDGYLAQIAPQVAIVEQAVIDTAASEAAALVSETNAAASEAAALASQGAASTSETNAALSETNAGASEAAADADRIAAEAAKTAAEAAATAASGSEAGVTADAAAAAASAAAALVSETNAGASAGAASASESAADADAIAAAASQAAALASQNAAAISETNAGASETAAALSETNAGTSETNAAASEAAAALSEASASADAATVSAIVAKDPSSVFKATMSATVNDLTGDGTIVDVPFNTESAAQDFVSFNTGTGVATIQKAGVYFIGASVRGVQSGGAATAANATITVNGVVEKETVVASAAGETRFITPVSGFFSLNSGDTVKITFTVQGSTLIYDIDNRAHQTFFDITRISPAISPDLGTVDYARVYASAGTAHGGASARVKVGYDTVVSDTSGMWDAANTRFNPKKAGTYIVTASCRNSAKADCDLLLYKNGLNTGVLGASDANCEQYGGSLTVEMNGTTDYLEAHVESPVALSIGTNTVNYSYFTVVGPLIAPTVERTYSVVVPASTSTTTWAIPANCVRFKAHSSNMVSDGAQSVLFKLNKASDGLASNWDKLALTNHSASNAVGGNPSANNPFAWTTAGPNQIGFDLEVNFPRSSTIKSTARGLGMELSGTTLGAHGTAVQVTAEDVDEFILDSGGAPAFTGDIQITYTVLE